MTWIYELVHWVVNFLPKLRVCRATHGGVKFRRGWKVVEIKPGMFWYWPVTTEYATMPVVEHSVDLPSQSLTTKDGYSIGVSVTLVIEISNVVKALGETWDVDDIVMEIGGASAVDAVVMRTWSELRKDLADGTIESELKSAATKLLKKYGVRVKKARFTDCADHTVIRTLGENGGGIIPVPMSEE